MKWDCKAGAYRTVFPEAECYSHAWHVEGGLAPVVKCGRWRADKRLYGFLDIETFLAKRGMRKGVRGPVAW